MRTRYFIGMTAAVVLVSLDVPLAGQSVPPGATNPQQRRQLEKAAQAAARLAMKPKVTCGMTVVPADPKLDPKAIKPAPDRTTKYTIRQVPPGACR
jgi:hypothetical protein